VTIVNLSGHGSPFGRALGRAVHRRGRAYVAMVGGLAVTLDGPQRRFLDEADVIAVHTALLAGRLCDAGIDPERIVVVPLGVDTAVFTPEPRRSTAGGDREILFVGRLLAWKGVDRLVKAIAEIRDHQPSVTLRIVGPHSDPQHVTDLRHLAERLGVADLPSAYRRAALCVLPSTDEGFGMVVPESLACGTPVVALAGPGGPAEMIEDGITGRLVDGSGLARALADLLDDPDGRHAMGARARVVAEARFGRAGTRQGFAEVIERALARA
jgi:glycosyltransferase involved in cell wall biosynthesis